MRLDEVAKGHNASGLVNGFLLLVADELVELTVRNLAAAQWSAIDGFHPIQRRLEPAALVSFLDVVPAYNSSLTFLLAPSCELYFLTYCDLRHVRIEIVWHRRLERRRNQRVSRVLQDVSGDASGKFKNENDAQKTAELKLNDGQGRSQILFSLTHCDNQAIILLHGAKTSEEGDEEDDGADDDQKCWKCEKLLVEKVLVAMVNALHCQTNR